MCDMGVLTWMTDAVFTVNVDVSATGITAYEMQLQLMLMACNRDVDSVDAASTLQK